jgi:four helix bundle protein
MELQISDFRLVGLHMDENELKRRTKAFGLQVIKLAGTLPNSRVTNIISNQLVRAATPVGANYRSACRGRSKPDFISKIGIAAEEADESQYWLEILLEANVASKETVIPLMKEANELTAILTATIKTARHTLPAKTPENNLGRKSKI